MDKIEVFNMALDILNIEPITSEELSAGTDPIVKSLNRFYGTALRKASRECDWSFLTEVRSLEGEDLGAKRGYRHSYELPDNLFRLIGAEGGDYIRVGSLLLTNGSPTIYAILLDEGKKNIFFGNDDLIPEDFWELIAYALAIFLCPRLASGSNKLQEISALYNTILQGLLANEIHNEKHYRNTDEFPEDTVI